MARLAYEEIKYTYKNSICANKEHPKSVIRSGHQGVPAGTADHWVNVSMQTPFGTCILDLFYAELHVQIQEQPAKN